jgi:hypothetical protein
VFATLSRLSTHKYKLHRTRQAPTVQVSSVDDAELAAFANLTKEQLQNNKFPSFTAAEIRIACRAAFKHTSLSVDTLSNIWRAYMSAPTVGMIREKSMRDNTAADYSRRLRRLAEEVGEFRLLRDVAFEKEGKTEALLDTITERVNRAVSYINDLERPPRGLSVQHAKNDAVALIAFCRFARAVRIECEHKTLEVKDTLFQLKLRTLLSDTKKWIKIEAARRPHTIDDFGTNYERVTCGCFDVLHVCACGINVIALDHAYVVCACTVKLGLWREAEQVVLGFGSAIIALLNAEATFVEHPTRLVAGAVMIASNACLSLLLAVISGGQRRQMYQLLQVCWMEARVQIDIRSMLHPRLAGFATCVIYALRGCVCG